MKLKFPAVPASKIGDSELIHFLSLCLPNDTSPLDEETIQCENNEIVLKAMRPQEILMNKYVRREE